MPAGRSLDPARAFIMIEVETYTEDGKKKRANSHRAACAERVKRMAASTKATRASTPSLERRTRDFFWQRTTRSTPFCPHKCAENEHKRAAFVPWR